MPSALVHVPDADGFGCLPPPGPDTTEDLALGLELKFLLLGLPLSEHPPSDSEYLAGTPASSEIFCRQAYSAVARVVQRESALSRNAIDAGLASIQPRAISWYDINEAGLKESDFWESHWIVKKANSVEHTKDDPRPNIRLFSGVVVPVELSSPMLTWMDPHAPLLVNNVVSRINTLPVTVNYTCDFHVHVGRKDGIAFTLTTLKKLATIFWLAEPILRSVRNPQSPNFNNEYTWGFEQRRYSRLALALERQSVPSDKIKIGDEILARIRTVKGCCDQDAAWVQYMGSAGSAAFQNEALRAIWRAVSSVELGLLLSGSQREHRRLGFNFSAFGGEDERARTNPRTIEFRFLEGTLDADMVLGWLCICGALVELATKGQQARFRDVIRYLLSQQRRYEELRHNVDLGVEDAVRGRVRQGKRTSRDMLFSEFMERIGVKAASYSSFQTKIRQEYGAM